MSQDNKKPYVRSFSPAEVFQQSTGLVKQRQQNVAAWENIDDFDRLVMLIAIRETMHRLLESPDWIPEALVVRAPDRIDVTFSVDLEGFEQKATEMGYERYKDLKAGLTSLADEM